MQLAWTAVQAVKLGHQQGAWWPQDMSILLPISSTSSSHSRTCRSQPLGPRLQWVWVMLWPLQQQHWVLMLWGQGQMRPCWQQQQLLGPWRILGVGWSPEQL